MQHLFQRCPVAEYEIHNVRFTTFFSTLIKLQLSSRHGDGEEILMSFQVSPKLPNARNAET